MPSERGSETTPVEHFFGVRQGLELRGKQVSDEPLLFQYEIVEMMPVAEHEELLNAAKAVLRWADSWPAPRVAPLAALRAALERSRS